MNTLKNQPFIQALQNKGKIFFVGGCVRDKFLNKPNKDIDLLVTGIPIKDIISLITPFGKIDEVGKSFAAP